MKKLFKRYKNWSLPSKMTFWGLLFAIISTPSAIIGYFQFFGNDDISNKLYRALQVNSRAYIQVKDVNILNYRDEGKVLVLDIENLSSFQVRNIKTKVFPAGAVELTGKFHSDTLNENIGISSKTVAKIAVLPILQLRDAIHENYPKKEIIDITLLNKTSKKYGMGFPFYVIIDYSTDLDEKISKMIALNAILK